MAIRVSYQLNICRNFILQAPLELQNFCCFCRQDSGFTVARLLSNYGLFSVLETQTRPGLHHFALMCQMFRVCTQNHITRVLWHPTDMKNVIKEPLKGVWNSDWDDALKHKQNTWKHGHGCWKVSWYLSIFSPHTASPIYNVILSHLRSILPHILYETD